MIIDVVRQIGAVQREVRIEDRDGERARVVVATQTYDAEISEVLDTITSAERIPRWFMPVTGDLRLGGRYQLEGNAGGEILACDEPTRLGVTWEYGGNVSWLEVRLSADGDDHTTLVLEHTAQVPEEFWAEFGPGAVGVGWDLALIGLAAHFRSGAAVDPAEAAAWTMSDEGRSFATESSQAWCAAAIADGDDEVAAREAAARTTAFYTVVPPETESPETESPSGADPR
jgi:uncharacterized protein YndB with AHSA1/START domain